MANFTKPFTDFSLGEISPRNLNMATSQETGKGVSYLENAYVDKLKGLVRRTGTLKVAKTKYPVNTDHLFVRAIPFTIGKGFSFVSMLYFVKFGELDLSQKNEVRILMGLNDDPDDTTWVLMMDFYKSTGTNDTYLNSIAVNIDNTDSSYHYYSRDIVGYPSTLGDEWRDVYGFNFSRFQSYAIVNHNTGSVEPFVIYYNAQEDEMSYFLHSAGMYETNKTYYPVPSIVRPLGLPFEQSNLNPNIAIEVDNYTEADVPQGMWFKLTSKYYDPSASDYVNWSSYVEAGKPNPFDKFGRYIRITIGNAQYVLRYVKDVAGTQFMDLTLNDDHVFVLVLDSKTEPLKDVLQSPTITTDFQVEIFNRVDGYIDNAIFFEQRFLGFRDGRIINSGVGNAFFMHQYRFTQDTIVGVYALSTGAPPGSPIYNIVSYDLLLGYSGSKQDRDPFDFLPLADSLTDQTWANKGQTLEMGGPVEVSNISGLEDSIYSFASIKSVLGAAYGSKSSISIKAGSDTIFVDGNGQSLRNYYYDGRTRQFVSNNLNDTNEDVVQHLMPASVSIEDIQIKEMSYNMDDNIIYCIVGPHNSLIGLSYHRDSGRLGWHRYTLGSEFSSVKVDVLSSCFLRNDKSSNVTYIVTQRDGEFYLERFAYAYIKDEMNAIEIYGGSTSPDKVACYLDFATRFVGATSNTWNVGMDYAGKEVQVFADGMWVSGNNVVDGSGILTIDRAVRSLVVGYKYGTDIIFLEAEPNFGGANGSFLHNIKTYNYVHLRLFKSYGGQITNVSVNDLEKIPYSNDDMITFSSLKLFTGPVDISLNQFASPDNKIRIFTDAPYPFHLSAAVLKGESNER